MIYKVNIDNFDRKEWERCAKEFADYTIYQTWPYQQVREEMDDQQVSRFIIKDENDHVASMGQVRIKHVKLLGLKIGYIQWGPLVRGKDSTLRCSIEAMRKFKQAYLRTRVNILRVNPNVCNDRFGQEFAKILEAAGFGFVRSVVPYHTMMLSLEGDQEQLCKRLHRSWLRYLKKAEENNIEIREGTERQYFEILKELYLLAKQRKQFKGLDSDVFIRTQELLSTSEKMNVVVAYYEGQPASVHATSHLGDTAVGILAASNEVALRCWASYSVWWRTFLAAKSAGMKRYDLGGIDPKKNPKVYQFKKRMGGEEAFHIGTFEAYTNPIILSLWHLAEKCYRFFMK